MADDGWADRKVKCEISPRVMQLIGRDAAMGVIGLVAEIARQSNMDLKEDSIVRRFELFTTNGRPARGNELVRAARLKPGSLGKEFLVVILTSPKVGTDEVYLYLRQELPLGLRDIPTINAIAWGPEKIGTEDLIKEAKSHPDETWEQMQTRCWPGFEMMGG